MSCVTEWVTCFTEGGAFSDESIGVTDRGPSAHWESNRFVLVARR